jgi:MFS family permease
MRRALADRTPMERRLVVSFSILSLGTGLSLSVLAVYLVRQLHAGSAAYGVAMSVAALCGMAAGPVAGRLADRANTRRTYAALVWTMAVATALLAAADEWVAFALVCVLMMCGRGSAAVLGALVGREIPPDRRVGYRAVVKTASNAAMLAGLGLGAVVLSIDSRSLFRAAFIVEALTLLTAGALIGPSGGGTTASSGSAPGVGQTVNAVGRERQRSHSAYRDRRFLALTGANSIVLLYSSLLPIGLPLWIAAQAPSLLWLVSVVTGLNVGVALILQIPVAKGVKGTPAAVRAGAQGTALLGVGIAMFALAGTVHGMAAKAIVLVLLGLVTAGGEVLYAASSWELVYTLAPQERIGEYQGVYNMGLDVSLLMAPVLFAWLAGGRHTPWWLAVAAVFLVCAALLRPIVGAQGRAPTPRGDRAAAVDSTESRS